MAFESKIRTIQWIDNVSRMVDQTKVPYEFVTIDIKTGQEMFDAIQTMIVRGYIRYRWRIKTKRYKDGKWWYFYQQKNRG